eukprot:gene11038-biopygen3386
MLTGPPDPLAARLAALAARGGPWRPWRPWRPAWRPWRPVAAREGLWRPAGGPRQPLAARWRPAAASGGPLATVKYTQTLEMDSDWPRPVSRCFGVPGLWKPPLLPSKVK